MTCFFVRSWWLCNHACTQAAFCNIIIECKCRKASAADYTAVSNPILLATFVCWFSQIAFRRSLVWRMFEHMCVTSTSTWQQVKFVVSFHCSDMCTYSDHFAQSFRRVRTMWLPVGKSRTHDTVELLFYCCVRILRSGRRCKTKLMGHWSHVFVEKKAGQRHDKSLVDWLWRDIIGHMPFQLVF
jgi:hypothetical protein